MNGKNREQPNQRTRESKYVLSKGRKSFNGISSGNYSNNGNKKNVSGLNTAHNSLPKNSRSLKEKINPFKNFKRGIFGSNLTNIGDDFKKNAAPGDSTSSVNDSETDIGNKQFSSDGFSDDAVKGTVKKVGGKIARFLIIKLVLSFLFLFVIFAIFICILCLPLFLLGIVDVGDISHVFDSNFNNYQTSSYSYGDEYISTNKNTGYWWPIGSRETTTNSGKTFATGNPGSTLITAYFAGDDAVHYGSHGAIDISAGINVENIIATRDGVVEYPTNSDNINIGTCDYYGSKVNCNSYGNYVKINHGDGMISIYGHMYANSIKVRAGDFVKQGQVIGKSGSSGNSTGGHLHFELRLNNVRVNPLDYVSIANPRGVESNAEFDSKVIE